MRNLILKCILLLSFVTPCQESGAQRVNKKGYKLVKSLDVQWYEGGKKVEWMCRKINYYYDKEGNLVGLDERYRDYGHEFFTTSRMDSTGRYVRGKIYTDGVMTQGSNVLIKPYTFIAIDKPITMADGRVAHYQKELYEHKQWAGNCHVIKMHKFYAPKEGGYEEYQRASDAFIEKVRAGEVERLARPNLMELNECGFINGTLAYYSTKDGDVYEEDPDYSYVDYLTVDGNMQMNYNRWFINNRGKDMTFLEDEYTNRINDTNIEYRSFSKISDNILSRPELSTEWFSFFRSRNLVHYEGRLYRFSKEDDERVKRANPEEYYKTYPDGKIIYDVEWNYRYEGGNLVEITIDTKAQSTLVGARRGVIKISYEY